MMAQSWDLDSDLDLCGDAHSWAIFSRDGRHRYMLFRQLGRAEWDGSLPFALFIGQNPSTAGGKANDMTITKEMGFAALAGVQYLVKVNLASRVATKPLDLMADPDYSGGLYNEKMIRLAWQSAMAIPGSLRIAAWGALPQTLRVPLAPAIAMVKGLGPLICLGKTKSGAPHHPSRLAYSTKLEPWP